MHGSLVPGSREAAAALGGQIPGLNAYLAERHTQLDSLTVAAPEGRATGSDQGMSQNMQQGTGQDSSQGAFSGRQASSETSARSGGSSAVESITARLDTTFQGITPDGAHISVVA
jgi:hypothetical protein